MKKITELDKNQKRMLLKSIAIGEIDRKTLTPETLVCFQYKDAFLGLIMQAGNEGLKVCYLGAAREAMTLIASYTAPPAKSFDRLESGSYRCKETGEELTEQQIKALEKDYMITIEVTSDLTKPATSFQLIPKSKEIFISDLQK